LNSSSQLTPTQPSAVSRATEAFERAHGTPPPLVVRAPGRVNLIGEHTDYNDGFVLPMALPFDLVIAAAAIDGSDVTATSEGFGSTSFNLSDDPLATPGWGRYLHGMGVMLSGAGHRTQAWTGCVETDIPTGASLSSSAALEVAAGLAFIGGADSTVTPLELARLGQRVENEIFGLPTGIMDQLVSASAIAGTALLIDCRTLQQRAVPLPEEAVVVVMDTGTRRELVDSAFGDRQRDCADAARVLGVTALRDATMSDLGRVNGHETLVRRARHVITENERTCAAAAAMEIGDAPALGHLMNESHRSLAGCFEVSGPALDAIVAAAQAAPGCYGARMTGGGFAGCAVALVERDALERFSASVLESYRAPVSQRSIAPVELWPVEPSQGADMIHESA